MTRDELHEFERILCSTPMRAAIDRATVAIYLADRQAHRIASLLEQMGRHHLARTIRAGVDSVNGEDLSSQEQTVIRRIRETKEGRIYVDIIDGVPTVAPTRHWRWKRRKSNS
jgi:hypothetical protein